LNMMSQVMQARISSLATNLEQGLRRIQPPQVTLLVVMVLEAHKMLRDWQHISWRP